MSKPVFWLVRLFVMGIQVQNSETAVYPEVKQINK